MKIDIVLAELSSISEMEGMIIAGFSKQFSIARQQNNTVINNEGNNCLGGNCVSGCNSEDDPLKPNSGCNINCSASN